MCISDLFHSCMYISDFLHPCMHTSGLSLFAFFRPSTSLFELFRPPSFLHVHFRPLCIPVCILQTSHIIVCQFQTFCISVRVYTFQTYQMLVNPFRFGIPGFLHTHWRPLQELPESPRHRNHDCILCVCASLMMLRCGNTTMPICHFHWHSHTFLINSHRHQGSSSVHVL